MITTIHGEDLTALIPKTAFILYQGAGQSFALQHEVEVANGVTVLGAGQPATRDGLVSALTELKQSMPYNTEILSPNILASSPDALVWWCAAGHHRVFSKAKATGQKSFQFHHPALVFAVAKRRLFVKTLSSNKRPDAKTQLYESPFYNCYAGGAVCTGNGRLPDSIGPDSIKHWETFWWQSSFTHANGASKSLTKYPKGIDVLWSDMAKGKIDTFDKKWLVPTKLTLGDWVTKLSGGR